ncbi:hypothetical protein TVAG_180130 [Trichomonas vaginalis G3]|uniref:Uncharacterized protein n=1 Tax=Trichomonas vaginalis (strain ATCC PRA-98 / G3) TaxID=412133 RepID=A2EE42_TRIV3|nr:armadillo (ARM) repeat-containing protein family [Trichomonas vaginalis G3]EAY09039.1 hypothetical protein TVAG_180130 [Trichomonas vaginalis G3]KAI5503447.1 armadillo (ARM) repeat-containing protein family [Trichomonas vaginalis G3]|eukprot:XP_001321262.1 hypothetical protein [Trichomonas vaginalis G3]
MIPQRDKSTNGNLEFSIIPRDENSSQSDEQFVSISIESLAELMQNIQNSANISEDLNKIYDFFRRIRINFRIFDAFFNLVQLLSKEFNTNFDDKMKMASIINQVIMDDGILSYLIHDHKIYEWLWQQFDEPSIKVITILLKAEYDTSPPSKTVFSYISSQDADNKISNELKLFSQQQELHIKPYQITDLLKLIAYYEESMNIYKNTIEQLISIAINSNDERVLWDILNPLSWFADCSNNSGSIIYTNGPLIEKILSIPYDHILYIDAINVIIYSIRYVDYQNFPLQITKRLLEYSFPFLLEPKENIKKILQLVYNMLPFLLEDGINVAEFLIDNDITSHLISYINENYSFDTKRIAIKLLINIGASARYERNEAYVDSMLLEFIEDNVSLIISESAGIFFTFLQVIHQQAIANNKEEWIEFILNNDEIMNAIEEYDDINDFNPETNGIAAHSLNLILGDYIE